MHHHKHTTSDATEVASLQRRWILSWDKAEGQDLPEFQQVFQRFYDFDAPVLLFDDLDPQRRTFRTVTDYAEAFWPTFRGLLSAEHAIESEPDVLVSGDLAVGTMVFVVVLTRPDGTAIANRCLNSQVWKRSGALGWRIARDHTSVEAAPLHEAWELMNRSSG